MVRQPFVRGQQASNESYSLGEQALVTAAFGAILAVLRAHRLAW
jgi:hypothetical protein